MVGVDQVLEKLATVVDPDLKKDIVSMGMIKDLELNSGDLKFTLELTTPACPFNEEIEEDVRKAIDEIDGIENFDMKVTAKVMEGRSLDADDLNAHGARTRTVQLDEHATLPRAQRRLPAAHGNALAVSDEHAQQVGVTILGLLRAPRLVPSGPIRRSVSSIEVVV